MCIFEVAQGVATKTGTRELRKIVSIDFQGVITA